MKVNDNAVNIEELVSSISNTIERNLTNVQEVLDLDLNDLIEIIDKLSIDDKDRFINLMINKQLEKLKDIKVEQIKNISRDVDEITDYYTSRKDEFNAVIEEGDYIADQLLLKVIDDKLQLPIDIEVIKKYCFSTELKEEQYYDAFMWIALRYIAISRCLMWQKYKENYELNKKESSK